MDDFFNWLLDKMDDWISSILELLPPSPFMKFVQKIPETVYLYLGYANYFLPIDQIVLTMIAWLTAIACYYGYSIAMRWIRAIK